MKYGFVIDNRKCIGCHACTTACKSEHEVPVGVNRTWVKQVEKGEFPESRRLFSVMRCNHCTDAPCVEICPTEALFIRPDGIVDFDKDRCIGCKSCMQACPYDALYIDPETSTAAKCNYCAHRIDVGLEPACVNVCPEHAIISGDMENPDTEIAQLLSRQAVKTRKPEKATIPNLFYIDADDASLIPSATEPTNTSLWGSQSMGVGHFTKAAEKMAFDNTDLISHLMEINGGYETKEGKVTTPKTVEVVMNNTKQVYNTPDKGILWGWEVSGYVWTKAISAGMLLVPIIALLTGTVDIANYLWSTGAIIGLIFLTLTGLLLVMDLDQPKRFVYVLLRPHWGSWLVKGGYAITIYGGLLALILAAQFFNLEAILVPSYFITGILAVIVAIYTAFLFAQAKGRDFWQSPTMAIHMLVHSIMAGIAVYFLITLVTDFDATWIKYLGIVGIITMAINLFTMAVELTMTHPTQDAKTVVSMILKGRYKNQFWLGAILLGNIIPLGLLIFGGFTPLIGAIAGIAMLIGIYFNNHIWVEAPQRIQLS
jgi:Fe-S-cluster-containing dehydrogenase component/formate-dependent nitrite reductase membrane component NrfD